MTTILALTADWHVNDTTALCPPVFRREKGEAHSPNKLQRAIWRAWNEYWDAVTEYKNELNCPVYSIFAGDLGDKNKHSNIELISQYPPDILLAMAEVAERPLEISDKVFVIRGTEAHTGGNGELEELFARDIEAEKSPDGTSSWWIWRAEIEGLRVHCTHHPPTQTRLPNKRGQAVARMCERLASEYDVYGWREKPDLAFWAHIHWSAKGSDMGIDGWTVPCWKGLGSFAHRIGISLPSPVGGLIAILDDGKCDVKSFTRRPPRPKLWKPD